MFKKIYSFLHSTFDIRHSTFDPESSSVQNSSSSLSSSSPSSNSPFKIHHSKFSSGFALVSTAFVLILLATVIAYFLAGTNIRESESSASSLNHLRAHYLAQSGIDYALNYVSTDTPPEELTKSFAEGSFQTGLNQPLLEESDASG